MMIVNLHFYCNIKALEMHVAIIVTYFIHFLNLHTGNYNCLFRRKNDQFQSDFTLIVRNFVLNKIMEFEPTILSEELYDEFMNSILHKSAAV